jgi:hypothetical protein
MLARLRYLRKAIQVLTVNGEISASDLSDEQKNILDEVELLLKPTAKAQRLLEGEKYPTISLVAYFLYQIRLQYERMTHDLGLSVSVRSLAMKLLDDFEKRYLKRTEPVFAAHVRRESGRYVGLQRETVLASAFDPRTKHLRPFIPENEHDVIWKEVLAMMIEVKEAAVGVATAVDGGGQAGQGPAIGVATVIDNDSGRPVQRARIHTSHDNDDDDGMDLFEDLIQYQQEGAANDAPPTPGQIEMSCRDELMRYRNEVGLAMFRDTQDGTRPKEFADPLQWWEEHKSLFPTIHVLSQRFLSIPATSAPSERLWSLASRIITIR